MTEFEKTLAEMKERHLSDSTPDKKKYECPKCEDRGWVEIIQEGHIFIKHCDMCAARRLMMRSGISQRFQTKCFTNFDTRNNSQLMNAKNKAVEYCQSFLNIEHTRNNSIMFCGQVGVGKTHLGTAICSYLMGQNIATVYMAYRNTVTKIKQIMTDEVSYDREMGRYAQSRVLYIDDLLKGKITESDVNIMYEIVNYRYMNSLPVIISTEKTLTELLEFDEAIGSRLIEMCRGNIIQLQGKELNYRLFS